MKNAWHEVWGSGSGRAKCLAPQSRIACGTIFLATAVTVPVDHLAGVLFLIAIVTAWILACRPPGRVFRMFFLLGLVFFLPYFLLVPLIRLEHGTLGWDAAFLTAWKVAVRGQAGLLITTTTAAAMSLGDLRQGLLSLPLPRLVRLIVFQILHQTAELYYETRRIADTIAVRGAAGRVKTGWKLLASLPTVWLPRVMGRAERIAAAMEIRGYGGDVGDEAGRHPLTIADVGALGLAISAFLTALLWRGGMP